MLAIDIGNTRGKLAWFEEGVLTAHAAWTGPEPVGKAKTLLQRSSAKGPIPVGWISVGGDSGPESWGIWNRLAWNPQFQHLHAMRTDLPFDLDYHSPETLGADRLMAVAAALEQSEGYPVLVIDMGSAITYDAADKNGLYLGGGIAPGMDMRFRALEAFTARLPKVDFIPDSPLIGKSTTECIRSGVIHGIAAEVNGMIENYRSLLGSETRVFLTGGNSNAFEKALKKVNFADPLLILKGIAYTLTQIISS